MISLFKNIIFLLVILGCTAHPHVSDKINKQENEWELLNKIKHENWNSEKITAVFGPPNSILREGKKNKELIF